MIAPHIVLVVAFELVLGIKAEHDEEDDDCRNENKILCSPRITV